MGEIGLSRFGQNHSRSQRTLTGDEFLLLFRNTFKCLNIYEINPEFLLLIYKMLLAGRSFITYDDFLQWIKDFLCALECYYGSRFYFIEDDKSKDNGNDLFIVKKAQPVVTKKVSIKFNFSNHDLAYQVRKRMFEVLSKYDKN